MITGDPSTVEREHRHSDQSPEPARTASGRPGDLADLIECDKTGLSLLLASRPGSGIDPRWHAAYLEAVGHILRKLFRSDDLVAPLGDIADHIARPAAPPRAPAYGGDEIDFIHAFAAAEISFLLLTGVDEHTAAQQVARRLIASSVPLPQSGGDPRGWVRLLKWRATLKRSRYPAILFEHYEARFEDLRTNHGTL